jgi:hypothetical protein
VLVPDPATTSAPARTDTTVLTAMLDAAAQHRLHAAMVLVGVHRVPAPVVLDLTWPQVNPVARELRVPGLTVHLDSPTVQLLHWHGCRQRLDRRRAGPSWSHSLQVFVDGVGRPYTEANADDAVTIAAARAGLPPLGLERLRELPRSTRSPETRAAVRRSGGACGAGRTSGR